MSKTNTLEKNKKHNLKLYFLYKAFSWDLLFYYAISFMFLNAYKGLSAAEIIFADSFYPFFKVLFQIPATLFVERTDKKTGLIVGNIALFIYVLFVLGCNSMYIMIIGNIFMALGFVLKNLCESNLIYDSLPKAKNKQKIFSKIDGKSSAAYYILEALSCGASGFLYNINPNIPILACLLCTLISILISHLFIAVPEDITNPDENHIKSKNTKIGFKKYIRDLKNAFKFIFTSQRLRSLIYFNAIFMAIIYLLISYRRSLLSEIGVSAQDIGLIFAALELLSSIASAATSKINKLLKNKSLTYLSLYFIFSIIISGLVVVLSIPDHIELSIVILMLAIQFLAKGPYYTLIKQYLSSFSTSTMRIKIFAANNLLEGIITGIISFIGSWLLLFTDTAHASIIIGCSSFTIVIILLEYMRTRVGLDPEKYTRQDIEFREVE